MSGRPRRRRATSRTWSSPAWSPRVLADLDGGPSRFQRVAIAHAATQDSLRGVNGPTVRELCDLAWGAGTLLDADSLKENPTKIGYEPLTVLA